MRPTLAYRYVDLLNRHSTCRHSITQGAARVGLASTSPQPVAPRPVAPPVRLCTHQHLLPCPYMCRVCITHFLIHWVHLLQDMACDTFLKICGKCKRKFVVLQLQETQPFVAELLDGLSATIQDLQPHQIHAFYEAVGLMIGAEGECDGRQCDGRSGGWCTGAGKGWRGGGVITPPHRLLSAHIVVVACCCCSWWCSFLQLCASSIVNSFIAGAAAADAAAAAADDDDGYMHLLLLMLSLRAAGDPAKREEYLSRLMAPPNAIWGQILTQATASPDVLGQPEVVRSLTNVLATNVSVCSSLGNPYLPQMVQMADSMLQVRLFLLKWANGVLPKHQP
jgi:hypothetical protein